MNPDKIDAAVQKAVDSLDAERHVTISATDISEAISKSNEDAKSFAVLLVQKTLHELLDSEK